jgi:hypothetical protein
MGLLTDAFYASDRYMRPYIYGGVVLAAPFKINDDELYLMSNEEADEKYGWLMDAPNLELLSDPMTGGLTYRSITPCITTLAEVGTPC